MSKWIPVEERLPDKEQDVLCSRGNHIGSLMDVYTYMGDDKWEDTYGYSSCTEDEGITHWMPLPEPPKMKFACRLFKRGIYEDDFCSYGERKDGSE